MFVGFEYFRDLFLWCSANFLSIIYIIYLNEPYYYYFKVKYNFIIVIILS